MARRKRKARGRRKGSRGRRSPSQRQPRPRDHLVLASALTVLTALFVTITGLWVSASIQRHGHIHLNFNVLILDCFTALFAAIEWTMWFRQR